MATTPDGAMPTLEEVADILSPGKEDEVTNVLHTDEERAVAAKILPGLAAKVAAEADIRAAKRMSEQVDILKATGEKAISEAIAQIRKDAKPLDPQEVERLLSQEYLTIPVRVFSQGKEREFTITELPAAVETRFLKILQTKLVPYLREFTSAEFAAEASQTAKIQKFIDTVPGAVELMADLCAVVLNPRNEAKDVNAKWVMDNLSSYRIFQILMGQVAVNRIRDFFSQGYHQFRL